MPSAARTSLRRSILPLALMGLIFFLSGQADLNSGLGVVDTVGRKLIHMAEYGLLAALWYRALAPVVERPFLLAALIALAYSIGDEFHQSFVHGRHGSPVDVAIDMIGVAIAAALLRYDPRVRSLLQAGPGEP